MGMLVDGRWSNDDRIIVDGKYVRNKSAFSGVTDAKTLSALNTFPQRFWLIASASCPWSHRAVMIRALKSLEAHVPMHLAHGDRVEGYAANGGKKWTVPGTQTDIEHLHQLYSMHDKNYTGRVTVPVLWDSVEKRIVSNESADIIEALDHIHTGTGFDFTLRPEALRDKIETANDLIYVGLNDAVYRAGFAKKQSAYEEAVQTVFKTLEALEKRLASSRFYFENALTETDIRLFPTLIRFDAIYYILFKCCRQRLIDYPNLWAYARDLYQFKGVAETVDFETMRRASYRADTNDETLLIAVMPHMNWWSDHQRDRLGVVTLPLRDGHSMLLEAQMPDLVSGSVP